MNRFFNKGLYKEGLRQSRIVGIIFSVITIVVGLIYPFELQSNSYNITIIDGSNFNIGFTLVFTLMAPFLALSLFSFLNKRNTSDFFHSIPHKRETLLISFILSGLTWILIALLVPTVLTTILCLFMSSYIKLNFLSIFYLILNTLAASFLVFAVTILAITLTGTLFSNIVTALLIMFLPRIIILIFINSVMSLTNIAAYKSFGIIGNSSYNIPFNFLLNIINGYATNVLTSEPIYTLYTFVLGLIYISIAAIIFKRRKSELAGSSAQNKWIQAGVRISISFLISLLAVSLILQGNITVDPSLAITVIVIFTFAAIAYFAYEVISTKGFKTIGKASAGFLVVLILDAVFMGGVHLSKNIIINQDFNVNDISFVQIDTINDISNYSYIGDYSFEAYKLEDIKLREKEIIKIVSDRLDEQNKDIKKNGSLSTYNNYTLTFKIKKNNGKILYRKVYLRTSEIISISNSIKDSGLINDWRPPQDFTNIDAYDTGYVRLTDSECYEIYNSFLNELEEKNLLFDDYSSLGIIDQFRGYSEYEPNTSPMAYINVIGIYGKNTYSSTYLITDKTPDTLKLFYKYAISAEKQEKIIEAIDDLLLIYEEEDADRQYASVDLSRYIDLRNNEYLLSISSDEVPENKMIESLKLIKEIIEKQGQSELDFSKPTYNISFYSSTGNYNYVVNLDDKDYESLMKISNKYTDTGYFVESIG